MRLSAVPQKFYDGTIFNCIYNYNYIIDAAGEDINGTGLTMTTTGDRDVKTGSSSRNVKPSSGLGGDSPPMSPLVKVRGRIAFVSYRSIYLLARRFRIYCIFGLIYLCVLNCALVDSG